MKTKLESDKQNKKKKEEEKKEDESPEEENKDHEGSGKHGNKCPKGKKNCDCSNVKGRGKKNIGKKKRKESDWIKLVKSVRKSENLSYKDALKVAIFCESVKNYYFFSRCSSS